MFDHIKIPKENEFEKLAEKCKKIIDVLNEPTINFSSIESKIDKFYQSFNAAFNYLFQKLDMSGYGSNSIEKYNILVTSANLKNSLHETLKLLFIDVETNISRLSKKLETHPSLKNNLIEQLTQFNKILFYLDRVKRGQYEGNFTYDYLSNMAKINDTGLIKNLIFNYHFGTDEFNLKDVKEKYPDQNMLKLGAIEALDLLFKNARTHESINDLLKNFSIQNKKT